MEVAGEFFAAKLRHEIDSWDLNEALQGGTRLQVVDVRTRAQYEAGHVPGARWILHRQIDEDSTRNWARDVPVVVYCDGVGCNAATNAALKLSRLGFSVREMIGGVEWWLKDGFQLAAGAGEDAAAPAAAAAAEHA